MEKLVYGFEMMGIGLLIVFFALALLSLVIMLLNKVLSSVGVKGESEQKSGGSGAGAPAKSNLHQTETKSASAPSARGESPEVIAAAMGAILFAMEEGVGRHFAITSVTRTGTGQNSWAEAGKNRLMQKRQDFVLSKRGKVR